MTVFSVCYAVVALLLLAACVVLAVVGLAGWAIVAGLLAVGAWAVAVPPLDPPCGYCGRNQR